jgi:hypothetical protein
LLAKNVLSIDRDEEIVTHDTVSDAVLRLFEADDTSESGPDLDDLRLDFKGPLHSEWNQAAARLLSQELRRRKDQYPLPIRSDAYLEDLFLEKIKRLRTIWRDAQPRKSVDGTDETTDQLENRLVNKKITVSKAVRHTSRRENVSTAILICGIFI